jgi:hypothetical protein
MRRVRTIIKAGLVLAVALGIAAYALSRIPPLVSGHDIRAALVDGDRHEAEELDRAFLRWMSHRCQDNGKTLAGETCT